MRKAWLPLLDFSLLSFTLHPSFTISLSFASTAPLDLYPSVPVSAHASSGNSVSTGAARKQRATAHERTALASRYDRVGTQAPPSWHSRRAISCPPSLKFGFCGAAMTVPIDGQDAGLVKRTAVLKSGPFICSPSSCPQADSRCLQAPLSSNPLRLTMTRPQSTTLPLTLRWTPSAGSPFSTHPQPPVLQ